MLLPAFTLFHVVLSLIGLASGFVVLYGFVSWKWFPSVTAVFLWTTLATSVTGLFFPVQKFMPSHGVGILSILALAFAFLALNKFHLHGASARTFVISSIIALYFNTFVAVVQSFKHIAPLTALAPTQTEPPFAISQLIVLLLFVALGIVAARRSVPAAALI